MEVIRQDRGKYVVLIFPDTLMKQLDLKVGDKIDWRCEDNKAIGTPVRA